VSPAALAEEVEAFITHPVPYELGEGRAKLRGDVRTIALASLLGDLVDLVAADAVSAESVTGAIRGAIAAGIECRHRPISPSAPEA
jgi:hypothetical protein